MQKWSISKASFLLFCETSIQCLHTTVDHLNERELTRPADRPYTNGYFLDLVEQVRQYASLISANRAQADTGRSSSNNDNDNDAENGDEHDASDAGYAELLLWIRTLTLTVHGSDHTLELVGGLGQTGRQAELIMTRGNRAVSLRTGEEVSAEESRQGTKRAAEETDEDEAARVMARRRKSAALAGPVEQRCPECDKSFKRPCDLTYVPCLPHLPIHDSFYVPCHADMPRRKHEKTHSRPWKCSEAGCKYHAYGWPTEKERDRHVNDKHSAAPPMHRCQFPPCPYESKRESNCKQHMEKAHGWNYVRSKNNGKTGRRAAAAAANAAAAAGRTPPTPMTNSSPASGAFTAPTPDFSDNAMVPSPSMGSAALPDDAFMADTLPFADIFGAPGPAVPWADSGVDYSPLLPPSQLIRTNGLAWDAPPSSGATFDANAARDEESLFGTDFNWSRNADATLSGPSPLANFQLATPATSVASHPADAFGPPYTAVPYAADPHAAPHSASLSPGGHGDAMLYSPASAHEDAIAADEGFDDFAPPRGGGGDFSLYDDAAPPASGALFGEVPSAAYGRAGEAPTGWSGRGTDLAHQLGFHEDAMEE